MIKLTTKPDAFTDRSRQRTELPFAGGTVSDYLPPEYQTGERSIAVTLNGQTLGTDALNSTTVADGDWIGAVRSPRGYVGVVINIAIAIYGVWSAFDQARRAKISAHHVARRAAALAAMQPDSATYGWGGMQNTINPGVNVAVLFGRSKVAGHIILGEILGAGQQLASVLVGVSEGRVQGLVAGSVQINSVPASQFSGVSIDSREGTTTQTSIDSIYPTTVPRKQVTSGAQIEGGPATVLAGELTDAFKVSVTLKNFQINGPATLGQYRAPQWATARFTFQVRHRIGAGAYTVTGTFQTGNIALIANVAGVGVPRGLNQTFTFKTPTLLTQADYEVEVSILSVAIAYSLWNGLSSSFNVVTTGSLDVGNSDITLDFVQFFREFAPIYPGLAIYGVGAIPLQAIGGMLPTITGIWEGRRLSNILTAGPPATFSANEEFNSSTIAGYTPGRNPALAILDILRNTRYGVGSFIDVDDDLDMQSFIDSRDFCDRLVGRGLDAFDPLKSSTGDGAPAAGTNTFNVSVDPLFLDGVVRVDDTLEILTGVDAGIFRVGSIVDTDTINVTTAVAPFAAVIFTGSAGADWEIRATERASFCDLMFDGTGDIKRAVNAIASNARLMVVKASGKVKLVPDKLGDVTAVFGMGNMTSDSYTHYFGGRVGANRVEVQFLDAEKNHEQDLAVYEDPQSLISAEGVVPTQISAFGVTRRTEALRIAKYHWLSNRYEDEIIEFRTGAAALMLEVGDVVSVAHDAIAKSSQIERDRSGRFIGNPSGTTLDLDGFYTFDGAEIISVQSKIDDVIHNITVASPLGVRTRQVVITAFGAYTPTDGDNWNTNPAFIDDPQDNTFRVIGITRSEDHVRRVRASRYHPFVFSTDTSNDPTSLLTNADVVQLSSINP